MNTRHARVWGPRLLAAVSAWAGRTKLSLVETWKLADSMAGKAPPASCAHRVRLPGLANLAEPPSPDVDCLSSKEPIADPVRKGALPESARVDGAGISRQSRNYCWYRREFRAPARPWENSYHEPAAPGDPVEHHPYLIHASATAGGLKFRMRDLATLDPPPKIWDHPRHDRPVLINEYGWLWLHRDSTPTLLTEKLHPLLTGPDSTATERFAMNACLQAGGETCECMAKLVNSHARPVRGEVTLALAKQGGRALVRATRPFDMPALGEATPRAPLAILRQAGACLLQAGAKTAGEKDKPTLGCRRVEVP